MPELARRTAAAFALIVALAALAGCATSPQESWFDHLDYLLWLNAAD